MSGITKAHLLALFPNASKSTLAANSDAHHPRTDAKLERNPRDEPLAAREVQKRRACRVHIRFVSVRKRLLDPDNISEKWTLDCLRFAGVIRGDEPDKITLETTQRKAEKGEEEHTEITIQIP